jgi:hypothetical protein
MTLVKFVAVKNPFTKTEEKRKITTSTKNIPFLPPPNICFPISNNFFLFIPLPLFNMVCYTPHRLFHGPGGSR